MNLTNPDEVFYAQTAKEMVQHNSWNVPYLFGQPQFEKPILTYWLLRIGHYIFGESNFGFRFFPAIFAIIGVLAVYWFSWIGFRNEHKAWFSALILLSSSLYVGVAKLVLTDTIFTVFILLSLTSFFWAYIEPPRKYAGIILTFIFSALAVLTKGPLGFILPGLVIILFIGIRREWNFLIDPVFLKGFIIFLLVALPWYAFIIHKYGMSFINEFFYNDHIRRILEAEHRSNDTWYFYPCTMFGGMFPWTIMVAGGGIHYLYNVIKRSDDQAAQHFLLIWIVVVFMIFESAHSKLVTYIMPLFPALAIMSGDFLHRMITKQEKTARIYLLLSTILLFVIPSIFIYGLTKYPMYLPPKSEVIALACLYIIMITSMIIILQKGHIIWNTYLITLQIPIILFICLKLTNVEEYTTSKKAIDYLIQNYQLEGHLLCTKMFLRGTRYFSNRDVAVLTINGDKFFSPHPVIDLDTEEKTLSFLKSQTLTYGFVTKTYWLALQRLSVSNNFKLELLKIIGDQYVIRIKI